MKNKNLKLGAYQPIHETNVIWKITCLSSKHGMKTHPKTIITLKGNIPDTNTTIHVSNYTSPHGYFHYSVYDGTNRLLGGKYTYILIDRKKISCINKAIKASEILFKNYLNSNINYYTNIYHKLK